MPVFNKINPIASVVTGTSGHVLGYLDGANTWSAQQTISNGSGTSLSVSGNAIVGTSGTTYTLGSGGLSNSTGAIVFGMHTTSTGATFNAGGNGAVFALGTAAATITDSIQINPSTASTGAIIASNSTNSTSPINFVPKGGAFTQIPNLNINTGTLTFATSQGSNQYSLFQHPTVTGTATSSINLWSNFVEDNISFSNGSFTYKFDQINLGAGWYGSRATRQAILNITGSPTGAADDTFKQLQADLLTTQVSANLGGSNPSSGLSQGFCYAGGDQMWARSGATNLSGVIGRETDVGIDTGASAASRTGYQVISYSTVQGHDHDRAFHTALQSGFTTSTVGWKSVFDIATDAFPIDATVGCIMQLEVAASAAVPATRTRPAACDRGIDLSGLKCTTADLRTSGGFKVKQGVLYTGNTKTSTAGAVTTVAPTGYITNAVTFGGGGSGYNAGDQLWERSTGLVVSVASVDGSGVITGLTVLINGMWTPDAGAPPANVTLLDGGGRAATANLTWTQGSIYTVTTPTILGGVGVVVASLPAASAALKGARTFVTDASTATPAFMATLTGGGSAFVPVFCDGTVWRYG